MREVVSSRPAKAMVRSRIGIVHLALLKLSAVKRQSVPIYSFFTMLIWI